MIDIREFNVYCENCKKLCGMGALECDRCLDYVNRTRLLLTPVGAEHEDGNTVDRTYEANWAMGTMKRHIDLTTEMDVGKHYKFLKMLENLTAACGLLYQQRVVKERIPNVDRAEKADEFNKAVRDMRNEQRPAKERKILTDREKAIAALTKVAGAFMTLKQIEEQVDKQMSTVGRNVG